jgi:hypothetical protein
MDWGEGAGFINDSIPDEPQQVTSSVQIGGDDKNKLIAAVSVSQVCKLTRPNEGLIIHGKKIYHVNLVAYVYEIVDINQQKIHLMVDDHSGGGPLEVSHIIGDVGTPDEDPSLSMFQDRDVSMDNGSGDQPRDIHSIQPGDYVRCIGVVKFTQDKANVIAYHLKIVEDPNEITMHIMEVIRDSLFYQKLQASGGVLPIMKADDKPAAQNYQQQQNQPQQSDFGKLSTRDKHVMTFLKNKAGDKGIHIDEIARNFTAFTKSEILDSLTMLSNEGLCWQSDDENVWCVE